MPESYPAGFRAAPPEQEWKKNYDRVTTEIPNPTPLSEILDGGPCPCCGYSTAKTYLDWEIISADKKHWFKRKRLIVTVRNTPGYKCTNNCAMRWPSYAGILESGAQALPIFKERGFCKTVQTIEWVKRHVLENLLPTQAFINGRLQLG